MIYAAPARLQGNSTMFEESSRVLALMEVLQERLGEAPEVAVVLGSGWAQRAEGLLEDLREVSLKDVDNWPHPLVPGHEGYLRLGTLHGRPVALCGGRVHAYEGYDAAALVRGVRALVQWGVPSVLLLNAAGSLDPERRAGTLMPIADHINLGLPNPLRRGQNCGLGENFLDLVDLYDVEWRTATIARMEEQGATLREGVYAGVPGPSYETPAEVKMLRGLGADAVGMSTIPEAIAARALGARVTACSLITNLAAGIGGSRPSHQEVLQAAQEHSASAVKLLEAAVAVAPKAD